VRVTTNCTLTYAPTPWAFMSRSFTGGLRNNEVGTLGLIAAGCANMALRAISAWRFLVGRFERVGVSLSIFEVILVITFPSSRFARNFQPSCRASPLNLQVCPTMAVLIAFVAAHATTLWTAAYFFGNGVGNQFVLHLQQLLVGSCLALLVFAFIFFAESARLMECYSTLIGHRKRE
jgi:hypothetical protein